MREDEREKPIERIVRTTMFAMVAVIIISSVALPMLASVGETTTVYTNSGTRMTYANDTYSELLASYDTDTAEIKCNSEGVYFGGEVSGVYQETIILSADDYAKGVPLFMIVSNVTNGWFLEYTGESPYLFTYTFAPGTTSDVTTFVVSIYPEEDNIYVQDPEGDLHIEKNGGYYPDLDDVYGFSYGTDRYLQVIGTTAKLRTDTVTTGAADVEYDEVGEGYHVTSIEFDGYGCDYMICPDYTVTVKGNVLDGWGPVRAMIGVIPVMIIIGAILVVVRRSGMSDR